MGHKFAYAEGDENACKWGISLSISEMVIWREAGSSPVSHLLFSLEIHCFPIQVSVKCRNELLIIFTCYRNHAIYHLHPACGSFRHAGTVPRNNVDTYVALS